MLTKRVLILLVVLAAAGTAIAAEPPGIQVRTTRPDATATFERSLADGKALVSVVDAKQEPVFGMTARDFAVARADAAAKVTSVEPIAKSVEVPRHVVLVLDNSYSMEQRKAIPKLLEGVGALLKHIRPVDDARIVVFGAKTMKVGSRDLHVETFQSNKQSELEAFVAKAYQKGKTTETTVLYEAMVAGLELIKGMPVDDPRFLIVFSDGEDINSAFKSDVVSLVAQGVPNLRVFAIDYMRRPEDRRLPGGLRQPEPRPGPESRDGRRSPDALPAVRVEDGQLLRCPLRVRAGGRPDCEADRAAAASDSGRQGPCACEPRPLPRLRPPRLRRQPPRPRRLRRRPAAPPAAPAPQGGINWWLWLLLLIVLILIIYFVSRKSDRK